MHNSALVAFLLIAACGGGGGGGPTVLETNNIDETAMFLSVDFHCDGEQSLVDWLVVFEVETTPDVVYADGEVFQRGSGFGAIELDETRSGQWYADIWEDDYGIDCELDIQGVTFYAEDAVGNVEILNL